MMKKWIGSLIAAALLICGAFAILTASAETATIRFTDIEEASELDTAIQKLVGAGIINGYPEADGSYTFRPQGNLTRAEFCKMVNKTFGYTEKSAEGFPDVTETDWFRDEVLIAKKQGYIRGYEDGTFRGNNLITRQEVCVILDRILGLYKVSDVTIGDEVGDWAREAVEKVIGNQLMPLEEGNTFRATVPIKRVEFSYVFVPFAETMIQSGTNNGSTSGGSSSGGSSSGGSSSGGSSSGGSSSGGSTSGGSSSGGSSSSGSSSGGSTSGGSTSGGSTSGGSSSGGNTGDNTGSNTGDNTGGNTGDNTGSNTGDNTGSNTGDNTGGNTGDNTGSNTGDNTGGNTGDNTGSNTGDNTGGNTGDNTGSNTGDNTGGNTGGNTGTQEPEEPVDLTLDDEAIAEMQRLYDYLDNDLDYGGYTKELRPIFNDLKYVLKDAIKKSETVLITPEYMVDQYYDRMKSVKERYYALDEKPMGVFNGIANYIATNFRSVLAVYFYDIIPEEAFALIGE